MSVTLDDLKMAIAKVDAYKSLPFDGRLNNAVGWASAERDAWRTAFSWHRDLIDRHGFLSQTEPCPGLAEWAAIDREEQEGLALIRERLK